MIHRRKKRKLGLFAVGVFALPMVLSADTFTITTSSADAFIAAGSAGNPLGSDLTGQNYGGAGTLAVAPASSTKGQFDSIVKFSLTAATTQFNTTYGAGNWQIDGFTLKVASNFGTQGQQPLNNIFNTINAGQFSIDYLPYDSWVEGNGSGMGSAATGGAVSFASKSTLYSLGFAALGTFSYTPPGNSVYVSYALPLNANLVTEGQAGGDVSLYFYAPSGSQVGYLFNSREFASNRPQLVVSATPVPEPVTALWTGGTLGAFWIWRRVRRT